MYNQRLDSMIHRPCMYQHTCSQKCDLEREREREREREYPKVREGSGSVGGCGCCGGESMKVDKFWPMLGCSRCACSATAFSFSFIYLS
jgi:hypothetical protein